jgi:succinate-semialdehyde dehydrogenase/glutarate-semialdehyde dehydrogenase
MLDMVTKVPLRDPGLLRNRNYIAGQWVDADSGRVLEVRNPSTGEVVGTVPAMSTAETKRAIEAAQAAWPAWRAMLAKERGAILRRI